MAKLLSNGVGGAELAQLLLDRAKELVAAAAEEARSRAESIAAAVPDAAADVGDSVVDRETAPQPHAAWGRGAAGAAARRRQGPRPQRLCPPRSGCNARRKYCGYCVNHCVDPNCSTTTHKEAREKALAPVASLPTVVATTSGVATPAVPVAPHLAPPAVQSDGGALPALAAVRGGTAMLQDAQKAQQQAALLI